MSFGTILSAVGTGISLISLFTGLMPDQQDQGNTKINIACADVPPGDPHDVAGDIDVRMFDRYGESIGSPVVDKYINRGNTQFEITYNHFYERRGVQAPYIKLSGNENDICVAWVAVKWADDLDWVWSGNWGGWNGCNRMPWHHSDAILGTDNGYAHRPDCTWLWRHHPNTAFSVYLPHYSTEMDNSYSGNKDTICNSPDFITYGNDDGGGLAWWATPPPLNNRRTYRRDLPWNLTGDPGALLNQPLGRLFTPKNDRLIVSSREQHSAVRLCESDTSWGPSFVSKVEKKYCDMTTKTLYDLCEPGLLGSLNLWCFDLENVSLLGLKTSTIIDWLDVRYWGDEYD